jgi:hypothetical protein
MNDDRTTQEAFEKFLAKSSGVYSKLCRRARANPLTTANAIDCIACRDVDPADHPVIRPQSAAGATSCGIARLMSSRQIKR